MLVPSLIFSLLQSLAGGTGLSGPKGQKKLFKEGSTVIGGW